eukprot:3820210-Rhodomonas_salina.1
MVVKQSADKHSMSADCDVRRALSALAPENSDSPDMAALHAAMEKVVAMERELQSAKLKAQSTHQCLSKLRTKEEQLEEELREVAALIELWPYMGLFGVQEEEEEEENIGEGRIAAAAGHGELARLEELLATDAVEFADEDNCAVERGGGGERSGGEAETEQHLELQAGLQLAIEMGHGEAEEGRREEAHNIVADPAIETEQEGRAEGGRQETKNNAAADAAERKRKWRSRWDAPQPADVSTEPTLSSGEAATSQQENAEHVRAEGEQQQTDEDAEYDPEADVVMEEEVVARRAEEDGGVGGEVDRGGGGEGMGGGGEREPGSE